MEKENVKIIRSTAHLMCKLTEAEIKAAGKALAEGIKQRADLESRLEALKQQMKAEATQIYGGIARNQGLIASEAEFRTVDVEVRFNFTTGAKEFVRMDTGEVYRRERITDEERQQMLPPRNFEV